MLEMIYAVAMIAAAILVYFGARLCRRPDTRLKGVLMIVMAVVLVGNVLIATTL
jgi:energy-converting hydrogenase Eha subunit B